MERSEWIWGLYVLVVELLRFVGRVDRDSGGERSRGQSRSVSLCGAILLHVSAILWLSEWSMKIPNCVTQAVVAGSWNRLCMRSKSNYMSDG